VISPNFKWPDFVVYQLATTPWHSSFSIQTAKIMLLHGATKTPSNTLSASSMIRPQVLLKLQFTSGLRENRRRFSPCIRGSMYSILSGCVYKNTNTLNSLFVLITKNNCRIPITVFIESTTI